tara:strand:- start:177 stop:818 length:642 start_codon:yes stop_codon:yes gene_type:complete
VFQVKDSYKVKRISYDDTKPYLLNIHYAKRMPSITYAYGLFMNDVLCGVVTYGTPPSATLRKGLAGEKNIKYILELNRLCLKNNLKNEASILVSKSLKQLPKSIIISFADTEQNHIGYVYQACNFYYCGLSAKRTDWKIKGKEHLHGQTIADKYRGVKNRAKAIRDDYGDKFYLQPRPRKHRYVFFVGSKSDKKTFKKQLNYEIKPYPKEKDK